MPAEVWIASETGISINSTDAAEGSQSAAIFGDSAWAAIEQPLFEPTGVSFVSLYIKPAVAEETEHSAQIEIGDVAIGFVEHGGLGKILVSNVGEDGVTVWSPVESSFFIDPSGAATSWMRLTIRHDADALSYDLFAGERLVATDVNMLPEGTGVGFAISSGSHATTLMDDLIVSKTNPLFPDADSDGIPDLFEQRNGA